MDQEKNLLEKLKNQKKDAAKFSKEIYNLNNEYSKEDLLILYYYLIRYCN